MTRTHVFSGQSQSATEKESEKQKEKERAAKHQLQALSVEREELTAKIQSLAHEIAGLPHTTPIEVRAKMKERLARNEQKLNQILEELGIDSRVLELSKLVSKSLYTDRVVPELGADDLKHAEDDRLKLKAVEAKAKSRAEEMLKKLDAEQKAAARAIIAARSDLDRPFDGFTPPPIKARPLPPAPAVAAKAKASSPKPSPPPPDSDAAAKK